MVLEEIEAKGFVLVVDFEKIGNGLAVREVEVILAGKCREAERAGTQK